MPLALAEAEIDRGFAGVDTALYGHADRAPATPFFRFPGFASSPALLQRLERRGIVVFGADLWASDWNPMFPAQQLQQVLARIESTHGGIVLFHDTKAQTAAMLPALLRAQESRLPRGARGPCEPAIGYRARAMTQVRHYRVVWATEGINRRKSSQLTGH